MIEVSVERLDFYKSELERLLGSEFLETQVKNVHTLGLKWSEVHRVQTSAHPLHLWWKPFKQNIQESKSVGQLRLSEQALQLLNLLSDLLDIETVPGTDRILAGLKNKSTFYSSVYEAAVAASYKSLGYNVIVIPESSIPGQKTPDLAVNNEHGTVYVECKSLEDISIGEATMWDQALERLSKALLGYRRNWIVRIRAGKQLESRDLERLIASITADIRSGRIESRQLLDGSFQVEYQFLCDPDVEFKAQGVGFDRGYSEYGTFGVQVSRADTATKWRNPHAVFVHPHVELNLTKRLINEFKKATGQIPKGGPGIVHLQVPYRKGEQLLAVVDEAYNYIFRKLRSKILVE
ncbi:MAG: hypothetical protein QW315_06885 [Candidatus Hadarchaeum sp.]